MEFLGRADHQVKIRGFRVELGEIEALLATFPGLREAIVEAREGENGGQRLVAYLLVEPGTAPVVGELRAFAGRSLPDFMVPSVFIALEELPLLPSGKVDRRSLAALEGARLELGVERVEPRNPLERVLAGLLAQVLGVPEVGVFDDFFELGGHSLLATQVIARVRETFDIDLQLRHLFESPTVAGLAGVLAGHPKRDRIEKTAAALAQLAGMSDEEVEVMLLAEETNLK
jgi:acyl carrier protein